MSKINIEIINCLILCSFDTFKYKMEVLTGTETETPITVLGIILVLEA